MRIYGKVLDIDGSSLPGATVSIVPVSGSALTMAANGSGNFDFGSTDFPGSSKLFVSEVEHQQESFLVSELGTCPLEIFLAKKNATLQEVVIVAKRNKATKRGVIWYALRVALIVGIMKLSSKVI
jgi:hypothetical protein